MKTTQQNELIAELLGISLRQVQRRLLASEPVALRAQKSLSIACGGVGERLRAVVRYSGEALPEVKKMDGAFARVVEELAFRVRQWLHDPLAVELNELRIRSQPMDPEFWKHKPYEQFAAEQREWERERLEQIAVVRKLLTGSADAPPEAEESKSEEKIPQNTSPADAQG